MVATDLHQYVYVVRLGWLHFNRRGSDGGFEGKGGERYIVPDFSSSYHGLYLWRGHGRVSIETIILTNQ